ncbi:MAG: helix-turn-helix domain-containing protein [Clostridia bacterium]|nr:helix-turn-helix domain-containing protein [Clostridia bacterium]
MKASFTIIGHNIKKARKAAQLTQEQAAEQIGISPLHYGRLERGECAASIEMLTRIADTLHTSIYVLLQDCILDKENHPALFDSPNQQTREYGEYALLLLDEYRDQIRRYYEELKLEKNTLH